VVAATGLLGLPRGAAAQSPLVDELRIVTYETPYGLDPVHEYSSGYLRSVGAAEGLLKMTSQGEVDVDIALWFISSGPSVWRIGLRPEVKFWSGKAVNAAEVVKSLERTRTLSTYGANLLKNIRIDAEDEWTVRFSADRPIPGLPLILTDEWLMIHNADSFGPKDNAFDVSAADYTGFFKIKEFKPRVQLLLERNEQYWGQRPRVARVRMDEVSDPDARSLAALSGEAHVVREVTPEAAPRIQRGRTMRLVTIPTTDAAAAYLNIQKAPFNDVRVRQALAWSLDRDEIVTLAFDGRARTAPSWLGTNLAYPEARRVGYTKQDLALAGSLLDQAGWRLPAGGRIRMKDGQPLKFRLLWWGGGKPMAETMQAQWAKAGAQVEVLGSPDYGLIESKRSQGDWDIFVEGWGTDGDPESVLARHVSADGDLNYMKFNDPVMNDLLAGFATLVEPEDRRLQALHVNQRQADMVPFIPISSRARLNAVSTKVHNYIVHFLDWQYEVHQELWVSA
ncbi:MAG TPA: ABC transporter substrate-binding protein, partial [Chloroflexota bacterium]|nr:ABC transporter substrate-binding protein [Chloroflexota bacterium]